MNFARCGEWKVKKYSSKFYSMTDFWSSRKLNEEWQILMHFHVTAHEKVLKDHSFFETTYLKTLQI